MIRTIRTITLGLAASLICQGICAAEAPAARMTFDLQPQPLRQALANLAAQTGLQILQREEDSSADGITAPRVVGKLSPREALEKLLANSGLKYEFLNDRTVRITSAQVGGRTDATVAGPVGLRLAQEPSRRQRGDEQQEEAGSDEDVHGIPEILVKGSRSINADIERTRDDPQPYVVFGHDEIQRSQAVSVEDFLRTRLPMNTASGSSAQAPGTPNPTSKVNLRGLGENQTLILIDGRRVPALASGGYMFQADLNGIPLAAIERIEVLPSTASGIYGGSATGGVINVVMRREFRGVDARVTYANTFDSDASTVRLDATGGFSLEGGRTQITMTGTHSSANELLVGDRNFARRALALQLDHNRSAVTDSGVPPLGRTVNILSNTFVDDVRQPLTLDLAYGGGTLGSTFTHLPPGFAGATQANAAALAANAGQYDLELPDDMSGLGRGLSTLPTLNSFALNARREFGTRVEAFVDLSRLDNKGRSFNANLTNLAYLSADAPNNPFGQDIMVRFPAPGVSFDGRQYSIVKRATGGVIVRLPRDWTGEVDYGWTRSRFGGSWTNSVLDSVGECVLASGVAAGVDPDGAGPLAPCAVGDSRPALNVLQEGSVYRGDFTPYLLPTPNMSQGPFDTVLRDVTLRLSGAVLKLPAGAVTVSTLVERRKEALQDGINEEMLPSRDTLYQYYAPRSQDVDSYYAEVRAPLVTGLELQASVRRDEYTTRAVPSSTDGPVPSREGPFPALDYTRAQFTATDYTLGLRYSPVADVTVRASFGTGFLPPAISQIASTSLQLPASVGLDPKRSYTSMYVGIPYTLIFGGNPNLRPEESRSRSVGVIVTPRFARGLRLSADYTRIEKVDEIQLPSFQFFLDNEDSLPGRITRGPKLAGDPPDWAGPISAFDWSYLNIARTSVEAVDIQVDYAVAAGRFGEFRGYALATWEPHYRNEVLPGDPTVDYAGFSGGPLKWRGNMGVDWTRGVWSMSWNAQLYDAYRVYDATASSFSRDVAVLNQGSAMVPRQMYHDLLASMRVERFNAEVSVGVQNVFDKSPPILATVNAGDPGYSTYGDPRLRRYTVSLRKSFQ